MATLAPIHLKEGAELEDKLKALQQGFARILVDNQMIRLDEIDSIHLTRRYMLIIDRIVVKTKRSSIIVLQRQYKPTL
jgi:excinuclease ABC subunit A